MYPPNPLKKHEAVYKKLLSPQGTYTIFSDNGQSISKPKLIKVGWFQNECSDGIIQVKKNTKFISRPAECIEK